MIETERLILREMTEEDFSDLYIVLADSDIMKHYPYTFDENRVKNWINCNIKRYSIYGFGLWGVILKENNKFIGDCGITMQNINGFIYHEIGYHIRKDYQKQGYAKEAGMACVKWGFENTPFKELFSYMISDNIPSINTAKSIGMTYKFEYNNEENIKVYSIKRRK